MSRLDDIGQQLVTQIETWLVDNHTDAADVPNATEHWLNTAPRNEIRRTAGYVKPNPRNDVAMFEAGQAHRGCPDECDGCRCFLTAPCVHCTDHEPADACGCPHYQVEDLGIHEDWCALGPPAVRVDDEPRQD